MKHEADPMSVMLSRVLNLEPLHRQTLMKICLSDHLLQAYYFFRNNQVSEAAHILSLIVR